VFDTIIIGAGIAGQTAAIYAARKRMNFLLISKSIGGQFYESGDVSNYPGIVKTTGIGFAKTMKQQLDVNGVKPIVEEVKKISKLKNGFKVISDKNKYDTKTVIIATGSRARRINVPGETKFLKKGVTYCAICDGPLFSGMDVAVIGGGNSAFEAVDFVNKVARKIYLITHSEKFKAHEYLVEAVQKMKNVEIITSASTKEILGDKLVTGLKYEKDGKINEIKVSGVFVEAGRTPITDFVKDLVKLDKHNHIEIDCQGHTKVPGVFAAGDCSNVHEYQYAIAAGQGATVLLKVARYLSELK